MQDPEPATPYAPGVSATRLCLLRRYHPSTTYGPNVAGQSMTQDDASALALAGVRTRRLGRGIGAALPARAAQALAPMILIPWLLTYLGVPLFGFWMTTTAMVAILSFSDLGLGNAVMSRLPPLLAEGRLGTARVLLSSSYAVLLAVAVALMLLSVLLGFVAPLGLWFGLDAEAVTVPVARNVFLITSLAFLANIPLGLIIRVQFARQRSAQAYLVAMLAALLSMALTLLAVHHDLGPVTVVAANLLIFPLVNLVYSCVLFLTSVRPLCPSPHLVRVSTAQSALADGLPFVGLTLLLAAASGVDYVLIGHISGAEGVAEFSIPARLLGQLGVLVSLMNMPFWSASADALARGDLAWVVATRRRLTVLGLAVTALALLLLILTAQPLYTWWLGNALPLSLSLLGGLGLWWMVQASLSPTFMVQNGVSLLGPQIAGFSAYLALSIPLKLALLPHSGVDSIGWISTACFLVTVTPAALRGYARATERFRGHSAIPDNAHAV